MPIVVGDLEAALSESEIEKECGSTWPACLEKCSRFFIQSRRYLDGDLDRFLVLAAIVMSVLSSKREPEKFLRGKRGGPQRKPVRVPINLHFITKYSQIPRETVRRKLQELFALGWVKRDANGYFITTEKVAHDLAPLTEICATYFAELQSSLADRNTTNLSVASCEQNDLATQVREEGEPPSIAEVNAVVKGFCETPHAGTTSTWVRIDPVDFYLGQD